MYSDDRYFLQIAQDSLFAVRYRVVSNSITSGIEFISTSLYMEERKLEDEK